MPGTYYIRAHACASSASRHKLCFTDLANNIIITGTSDFCATGQNRSFVEGTIVVTSTSSYKLNHYITTTSSPNGLGINTGIAGGAVDEIYTTIFIQRIK